MKMKRLTCWFLPPGEARVAVTTGLRPLFLHGQRVMIPQLILWLWAFVQRCSLSFPLLLQFSGDFAKPPFEIP